MSPPRRGDAVELLLKHGADPYQAAAGIPQEPQEIYPLKIWVCYGILCGRRQEILQFLASLQRGTCIHVSASILVRQRGISFGWVFSPRALRDTACQPTHGKYAVRAYPHTCTECPQNGTSSSPELSMSTEQSNSPIQRPALLDSSFRRYSESWRSPACRLRCCAV